MSSIHFDRPIIILSAPRSGSTLLFETLKRSQQLCTIGDESHAVIEQIGKFSTAYRGYVSNHLAAADADPVHSDLLRQRFAERLQDRDGNPLDIGYEQSVRFLEKTPKNALRVDFLNKVFPDALFVYLVRDPRENIASIMDAWFSQRFRTYPNLPGFDGKWSLLLPPNWQSMRGKTLAQIASFQWCSANQHIINSLKQIARQRWTLVNYRELVSNPQRVVQSILDFCQLADEPQLLTSLKSGMPLSQYTLTAPNANKWHSKASLLADEMPNIEPTLEQINQLLLAEQLSPLSDHISRQLIEAADDKKYDITIGQQLAATVHHGVSDRSDNQSRKPLSRNAPCPCGSGQRYKSCHGKLT
ncbi:sulfotransferase [Thalassotalea ponticola]|uniref:sulfotransferase family protein n=1 Tax=Thalassotalea ponticola TaxID=1523392 RepID=UPI0025B5F792|nr:sulfotransferase [Thalassotalea ponticola]MDN3653152.1 sulfotransferase [Thalassotalea ponticola]